MIRSTLILCVFVLVGVFVELSSCSQQVIINESQAISFVVEVEFVDGTIDTLRIFSEEPPKFNSDGSITTTDHSKNPSPIITHANYVRKFKILKAI